MISISQPTPTVPRTIHYQQYHYPSDCQTEYHDNRSSSASIDLSRPTFDNLAALNQHQISADLMQSDPWGVSLAAQYAPSKLGRFPHHQRDSSLDSLASTTGPASPFNQNTSNPQIAITDSGNDGLSDMHPRDDIGSNSNHHGAVSGHANGGNYYQLAKTIGSYPGYQNLEHGMSEMAYPMTVPGPNGKPRLDRGGLLPAPEFAGHSSRSHPTSVASSVAGDSPATPTVGDADLSSTRRKGFGNVPKLDRTMTDVYGDELYSPNFTITSTSPLQPQMGVSPTNDVFSQRLHAANNQHLSAAHSPVSSVSRGRSPFRTGSPLAPSAGHDFGAQPLAAQNVQFTPAQRMHDQNKAQHGAQTLQQHMTRGPEPETPKTISPKDAVLEFNEPDGESNNFPLFPQESTSFEMDQFSKTMASHSVCPEPNPGHEAGSSQFSYLPSQLPTGLSVPQQYPFIAHSQPNHDTPPRLSSAGSSSADSGNNTPAHLVRPINTAADAGTYTCTYHGCTLRFETPALLQKHKREGHRQAQPLNGSRSRDMGMTSALNSQAGPHRCDRINPSTGKPCNTVFSRPYDLTRHEDTIHNARKQKVRCDLCTEEKTFSRADALTRHYRVCHPDVELPGKHRRRGGG